MTNDDKVFYGDGRVGDYNPRDYLKKIQRTILMRANMSEAQQVKLFSLSLGSASEAEAWFDKLTAPQTATFAALEAEFDKRWPKEVLAEKTAQEMSDEMMSLEMCEDEMGKKVDVDGTLVYSHVRWAKQMRLLCGKDTAGLLIPQVRKNLPQAMRDLVGSGYTDWTAFLKAVTEVSAQDLTEAMEKEQRLRKYDAILQSPTAPLHTALARTTITASPSPSRTYTATPPTIRRVPAPANTNPFVSPGPIHPSNLFAPRTPTRFAPSTPTRNVPVAERLQILQRNILPHHPSTPAGLVAYTQQVTAYNARNGDSSPNEYRPYPLTPGTEPLDSGARFSCAQLGHMAKDREGNPTCPNPTALPEPERKWRNIASYIYRHGRDSTPSDMRFVAPVQPFYDPNTDSYFTLEYGDHPYAYAFADEQGKGPGSSV